MIVQSTETVSLIGGACVDRSLLEQVLSHAPRVVAADSGADTLLAHGIRPEAVIGDFDSISPKARKSLPEDRLHHIAEQDSTDFDKCLRNIDAPLVLGLGFSGDRQDHQLACYNSLVRHPSRRCVLVGPDDLVFLTPPALHLDLEPGQRVSLFPFGAVEGVSDGLRWPIGGLNLAPDGMIGTSNEALGPVDISVTSPKLLMFVPSACLDAVLRALAETSARWS